MLEASKKAEKGVLALAERVPKRRGSREDSRGKTASKNRIWGAAVASIMFNGLTMLQVMMQAHAEHDVDPRG